MSRKLPPLIGEFAYLISDLNKRVEQLERGAAILFDEGHVEHFEKLRGLEPEQDGSQETLEDG